MRHFPRAVSVCLALAVLSGAAVALAADDSSVKLISRGARHDALTAVTYKPFDGELWGKLGEWTNGSPLTKESIKGKPVLVVVWASWYLSSHNALAEAQKVADKYPELVVVGVHHWNGYEKSAEVIATKAPKFAIAHDSKKDFFTALKLGSEGAPVGFYFIDRAGNLRFPDVDKSSLEAAAKIVSDEKAEDAAKAEARSKEAQKEKGDTPLGGPGVKSHVSAEDYKSVKWPAVNNGGLSAKNLQGKPLPAKFGKEKWLEKEPSRDGKIVVIDFWATWCGPCKAAMPHLDELYKKYQKDVVVIGISDEDEGKVKSFIKQAQHSYPQAIDPKATIKSSLGIQGIPHVVVISTDGVIRWQGNPHPNADQASLDTTIAKLIEVDPGVKARLRIGEEVLIGPSLAEPLLNIVLHEPEIPNNTGNIGRTCIATGCALHLIKPLGFDTSEKACRRAGLDYWPRLRPTEHESWPAYLDATRPTARLWLFTTKTARPAWEVDFQPGDHLVFGKETRGLPPAILESHQGRLVTLPMVVGERSLNLATAVCAAVYEAIRQMTLRGQVLLDSAGRIVPPARHEPKR